jgi:uncharacterized damage-inducible protein DinB
MTIGESFLPEFDQEMSVTRKLLARVPSDKGGWKPHPKSFSLAHLAQLVARMPGWQTLTIRNTELNLGGFAGYSNETTDWLLNEFDKNVGEARAAIAGATDADLAVTWSLKAGDKTLFSAPRVAVVRQNMNHLIHHRGQLTVYLRELDVPSPSIYGPTADEGW